MAKLIYVANVSLDGYIEDAHGSFEWTAPTDEGLHLHH
jgi:dihydrofolate reductase